jgi:hypothetical protein
LDLTIECYVLLNEEIGKPNLVITDAMVTTVIMLSGIKVNSHVHYFYITFNSQINFLI